MGPQLLKTTKEKKSMWKKGEQYLCIHSTSNAYKVGHRYDCVVNEKGVLCLRAGDGLLDPVTMLVSTFRLVKQDD